MPVLKELIELNIKRKIGAVPAVKFNTYSSSPWHAASLKVATVTIEDSLLQQLPESTPI